MQRILAVVVLMITFSLFNTSIAAEKSKSEKEKTPTSQQKQTTMERDPAYVIIELADEAKRALVAKRPIGKNALNPVNLSLTMLPKNYTGHDLRSIYEALKRRKENTKKDEYETTEHHKQRFQDEDRQPLIGTLTVNDLFSFVVIPFKRFNADSQTLTMLVSANHVVEGEDYSTEVGIYGPELYYDKSTYIGSNVYGESREIVKIRREWVVLAFSNALSEFPLKKEKDTDTYGWFEFVLRNITPETAKAIRENLHIAFIYKLEPVEVINYLDELDLSYLSMGALYNKPTTDNPGDIGDTFQNVHAVSKEIWIFNKTNGQILLKVKTDD